MIRNIATVISRICDPFVMLAAVFIILVSRTPVFFPAFICMVLVPLALFFIAWKTKFVADWDMSDRRERPKILWFLIAMETLCVVLFHLWVIIPILIALIGFSLITHFWKISGHAMAAGLATGVVVSRFGWAWWPVLLIVPLVGWSRVVRRNHTVSQVIAGAAYSWILLVVLAYWFIG